MAGMTWTFSDVYTKVSEFLGLGSSPSGTDLTKVKDIVYRGYLYFLFPMNAETGETYDWSFLKKDATLSLRSGEWVYILPSDFYRMSEQFEYLDNNNRPTMDKVTPNIIKRLRSGSVITDDPCKFAVRYTKYNKSLGYQPQEALFYPTPGSLLTLTYSYIFIPPKPENDADCFIGNTLTSEAILESCLAVAEQQEDEREGVHTKTAAKLIQNLILSDQPSAADTVGMIVDPGMWKSKFTGRRHDTKSITSVYEVDNVNEG